MKFTLAILLFLLGHSTLAYRSRLLMRKRFKGVPSTVNTSQLPSDQWFKQVLDHSDLTNPETWWQRYRYNNTWFQPGSDDPVFLLIEGEGEASAEWLVEGAMMVFARQYEALCFQLEHRFYGQSRPKADLSVKNLRYLNSKQALADIAAFITGMNEKYKLHNNKWVVFGGSYAGALAAWARMKYPHLIHGAISSSAPLLAQENFKAYDNVVRAVLSSVKPCANNVHLAALAVNEMLQTDAGAKEVATKFNFCSPVDVTNPYDVATFKEYLADTIAGVIQYNGDYPPTVNDVCSLMNNKSLGDPVDRYGAVITMLSPGTNCITTPTYIEDVTLMKSTTYSEGGRQWAYQTCTEFGYYQTSGSKNDLFGSAFNLQYFIDQCRHIFGEDFDEHRLRLGIARTNVEYGALKIDIGRVAFINGNWDPWHVLGVNSSNNPGSWVIMIEGGSHCQDMDPPSPEDSEEMVMGRNQIRMALTEFFYEKRQLHQ